MDIFARPRKELEGNWEIWNILGCCWESEKYREYESQNHANNINSNKKKTLTSRIDECDILEIQSRFVNTEVGAGDWEILDFTTTLAMTTKYVVSCNYMNSSSSSINILLIPYFILILLGEYLTHMTCFSREPSCMYVTFVDSGNVQCWQWKNIEKENAD